MAAPSYLAPHIKRYKERVRQARKVYTVDNGLLTPTLTLKRRIVIDRFGDAIDKLYADEDRPPERARASP